MLNTPRSLSDVAVVVLTCQKYNDVLEHFFHLFDRFWPDCKFKKYLITDKANQKRPGFIELNYPSLNWSGRLKEGLKSIDEKYIILLLDDYLLYKEISTGRIDSIIDFIQQQEILYFRLVNIPIQKVADADINAINPTQRYGINFQAAIWDKDWLGSLLPDNDVSAWEAEVHISHQYLEFVKTDPSIIDRCVFDVSGTLDYLNGIIKGSWYPKSIKKLQIGGYVIPLGTRRLLSKRQVIQMSIVSYFRQHMPNRFRIFIKNQILRRIGFKFFSCD